MVNNACLQLCFFVMATNVIVKNEHVQISAKYKKETLSIEKYLTRIIKQCMDNKIKKNFVMLTRIFFYNKHKSLTL